MHSYTHITCIGAFLIATLSPMQAQAAESEFDGVKEGEESEDKTTLSAELGGAYATGNVWFYTINTGVKGGRRWGNNEISAFATANLGRAAADTNANGRIDDDERPDSFLDLPENARRIDSEVRYDRYLSETNGLYVLAAAFHDVYSGYSLRSHAQIGYSRRFIDTGRTKIRTELGFDAAQEYYTPDVDPRYANVFAARLLIGIDHQFNDSVSFTDRTEIYENVQDLEDLRIINAASVTSKLSDVFSMKITHALIFDNQPVEGFQKTDQTVTVSLVASLL
ncbi:MAG: DUF481 domain-containing protein [Myxococcota bacterium]